MDNEKQIINDDITGAAELKPQQMEDVPGGGGFLKNTGCNHEKVGPRYKKKSLFGWNWYAICSRCKQEVQVEEGDWFGDPD